MTSNLKIAVVTGAHEYDVLDFHRLFRELPGVDAYIQHLEDYATDPSPERGSYDAVVFFNYHQETPGTIGDYTDTKTKPALESLIDGPQGIVVLHHAILCYPDWAVWQELSGVTREGPVEGMTNQKFQVDVVDATHPITSGIDSWTLIDETYIMDDADGYDSHMLLTTEHSDSMKTLGWTRERSNGRTFCLQSGHDNQTWTNPQFRTVLGRGIEWVTGGI